MKYSTAGCLFLAVFSVLISGILFGAPVISSAGLSWDSAANVARVEAKHQETMARISQQDADSERWHDTARWIVVAAGVVIVTGVTARAWQHHADKRAEVQIAALPLLQARPGAYLDIVDGAWYVVDDARRELVPVERRLNG